MTNKFNILISVFVFILASCGQEPDSDLPVSWTSLSKKYNITGLISLDYNKNDKVVVLGYENGFSGRYEIRDENFNILKEVKLSSTPYSILYTQDSIYAARDVIYFQTENGLIIELEHGGRVTLFDPKLKKSTLLYTDPAAASYISFNSFVETDQYYILSIYSASTCVFIDKTTFQVTNFSNSFKEFKSDGGWSVVKTKQGEIILSILLSGKVVYGYLTYNNGSWEQFRPTSLSEAGKIKFIDSRNYAWIDNGYDNSNFKLYDLENNRFIKTTPPLLSGNFFGYSLHEFSNGDIILMSGTLVSSTYELMQIHLSKQ